MYEFGTTSEQLAEIKVAASQHAQYNPHALLKKKVTVEEVLNSPLVADPLHRLDCCVITDGGGAVVLVSPEVARDLPRRRSRSSATASAQAHQQRPHRPDVHRRGWSGPRAFEEAGVTPLRTSTTPRSTTRSRSPCCSRSRTSASARRARAASSCPTARCCRRGGKLPFNTDGGGLCNNHPANRGGMTKIIEAVRQLRGEAAPRGPGAQLRHRAGARHRRLDRLAHGQRNSDSRAGGRVTDTAAKTAAGAGAADQRRDQGVLGRHRRGQAPAAALQRLRQAVIWYPRLFCPECGSIGHQLVRSQRQGHGLQLHDQPPRAGRLSRPGATCWRTWSSRKARGC